MRKIIYELQIEGKLKEKLNTLYKKYLNKEEFIDDIDSYKLPYFVNFTGMNIELELSSGLSISISIDLKCKSMEAMFLVEDNKHNKDVLYVLNLVEIPKVTMKNLEYQLKHIHKKV